MSVDRIFLDHENPRHVPYDTQEEVIAYLCKQEQILPIARDIVSHGLSPLELFALLPGKVSGTYIAAEGNRRLCALKLLNDPDLAPAHLRKDFEKLSKGWEATDEVASVEFKSKTEVKVWLDRLHDGLSGGIGRRHWNADQKQRNSGKRKNSVAMAVLDYAVENNVISAADRAGKLTTVQRFLGNSLMQEALGIDRTDPTELKSNRPKGDFDKLLTQFVGDLQTDNGQVTSRKNKPEIDEYARKLSRMTGLSGETVAPAPLTALDPKGKTSEKAAKPKSPGAPKKLPYDQAIADELGKLGSYKLSNLYFSICNIPLTDNTPIVAIGLWAFVESLCAKLGSTVDFISFLSVLRLTGYGLGNKEQTKGLREAIERVSKYGNTTKHDEDAAHFNGTQLANDMEKMRKLIFKCVEDAVSKK
ncbi:MULTISPECIES: hypothetical protein [unclassified Mesorhizobium]|uniref:hypothetical protein n=1 Tax=unclassified Mesorhizobium TaxID=325217 RepID=UPI000FCA5D47|nr:MULTISPECIES: hypothetical protein [unclassified Mesorhizobium]RUT81016.1 hypothetical protein EOD14_31920 [Mesorhizobium sp. M7A.T.Ca.US.000.02.1.1]RUT93253.1 hypothetical protein EOD15_07045 [Mesorhizobium sp. M7A.T.Ca.US.000.02.2.1]RUT96699.1 hypothetical protein EOD12_29335 [Mesorhizobium sp. M7A.T.Ca.TU.009.02.1.1]TJV23789.1 MAG: hypothetical protein E5Y04_20150 [Mesorhizobium sp.]